MSQVEQELENRVVPINIGDKMENAYIEYAMSVIVARALPDVRDGLKPVHRRILYSMNEMGLDPNKGYKKSARITGDTMGKYHPHGNSSIYDAMVRMAQPFSMRYPLVDGHGNFGSLDGDGAAAERYTEAKLSKIATLMLEDLEKETVDFVKNYDEELEEPTVLPAKYPNLLVNGANGIAVGMATNIPPHNLTEVIDGVLLMIKNRVEEGKETSINELMTYIKGPDFPTSANIYGKQGIIDAYTSGRGSIVLRGEATIETKGSKDSIVITEIPYQVNKAKLVSKIAELVKDKKIEGISDLRDESDRNGIRVVVECKRDANANVILNLLYKNTQLQTTQGVIMLALVNNKPEVLTLYDMLYHYLEHQKEVIRRRTHYELNKAEARQHLLDGYIIALDNIEDVIQIIKTAESSKVAMDILVAKYSLTEVQATAILGMQLRRLTGLERDKLAEEYKVLEHNIAHFKAILNDDTVLYTEIKQQLEEVKDKYGEIRRTKIIEDRTEFNVEDLISDDDSVLVVTKMGYIKRVPLATYKTQHKGGRGVVGMQTREEDTIQSVHTCTNLETILMFTNKGKAFKLKVYDIPESSRTARGTSLVNLLSLTGDEKVSSVVTFKDYKEDEYLFMVTQQGTIKKTALSEYKNMRNVGLKAVNLQDDDLLVKVIKVEKDSHVLLGTSDGYAITFDLTDIRPLSRSARGVRGVKLNKGAKVIDAFLVTSDSKVLSVTAKGMGKCTDVSQFRGQKRGGRGLRSHKVTDKTGLVVALEIVEDTDELLLISSTGIVIRIMVETISNSSRNTQGSKLINLDGKAELIGIAKIETN